MTRGELAEAVNQFVWHTCGEQISLDADTIARYERGRILWPGTRYREGLRAVLGVDSDLELGFQPTRRGRTSRREDHVAAGLDGRTLRLLSGSERDSVRLLPDDLEGIDDIDEVTRRLAVAYLGSPPTTMLREALDTRREALRRLEAGLLRGGKRRDAWLVMARLQGVLTYAALDLGAADIAGTHAAAGHAAAVRAGDGELTAWARGTQALVARFSNDFARSEAFILDGMRVAGTGSARIRLLCGLAQSRAGIGDAVGTRDALDRAEALRERATGVDEVGGIFSFSVAKQHYYSASSLVWLDGKNHASRATSEAARAVDIWQSGLPADRSLGDEALARVYRATAHVQLGEIDAARDALTPVLELPAERQISWIGKRLTRIAVKLESERFKGSREAADLAEQLRALR